MIGYYYLHTNGSLIFKRHDPGDFDESSFVRKWWCINTENRADAWCILLESLDMGLSTEQARGLATKWNCDAKDLVMYMVKKEHPSPSERRGITKFIDRVLDADPDEWFDWLGKTPKGGVPDWASMPRRQR